MLFFTTLKISVYFFRTNSIFFIMINLDNIYVVLSEPKGPMNVGSTARAMNNCGITDLVLVDPCDFKEEDARKMASGCNDTLLGAKVCSTTEEAVADAGYIIGMTCREGKNRQNMMTTDEMVDCLIPLSKSNKVALLFGTERTGLNNEEIALCNSLVNIPTSSMNASLNLAQAVLLICHEIFKASHKNISIPNENYERELATSDEVELMYDHMEDVFGRIGYTNPQNPEHIMMALRAIFGRTVLDAREVKVLRGMVGKIDCYASWIERGKTRRLKND